MFQLNFFIAYVIIFFYYDIYLSCHVMYGNRPSLVLTVHKQYHKNNTTMPFFLLDTLCISILNIHLSHAKIGVLNYLARSGILHVKHTRVFQVYAKLPGNVRQSVFFHLSMKFIGYMRTFIQCIFSKKFLLPPAERTVADP